jgi:ubiquinone/menaquinone biosynthesis C-methylase UbiE/uncharacterized protein YbaR (Trm112 family)
LKKNILDILACPSCLEDLTINTNLVEDAEIIDGDLLCSKCQKHYIITKKVPIFGMRADDVQLRTKEIQGENKWTSDTVSIQEHIDFAKQSFKIGEEILKIVKNKSHQKSNPRVLDLGAGWGIFQSWQFYKNNYNVISLDLCPEFIFASDRIANNTNIERIVADCTILPFKNNVFDIILCKELIHHVNNPSYLFDEIMRVAAPNAIIVIKEPCGPIILGDWLIKFNKAAKIGITHFPHSYLTYKKYFNKIATDIEISNTISPIDKNEFKLLSIIQKPIMLINKIPFINKIISQLYLMFIGGDVKLIGKVVESDQSISRKIIPSANIELNNLNIEKIAYYREQLIPSVFMVFESHYKP